MLGVFSQSGVSKCWVCFHKVECLNVGCVFTKWSV